MPESDLKSTVNPSQRPWYRLHRSTWLVTPLGLIVGVLMIVPGELGWYPERLSLMRTEAVVHGWPLPFLWRTPEGWGIHLGHRPLGDDATLPWKLTDSVRQVHWLSLALDIGVALVGIAAFAALVEWRRRRRRRFFSFRCEDYSFSSPSLRSCLAGGLAVDARLRS